MHIFQCSTHRQHTLDMAKGKGSIGLLFNKIKRKAETKHLFLEAAAIRRTCADVTTRRERSLKDWQRNVSTTNKLHLRVPCLVV